jgi:hypothetical protein
MQNRMSKYLNTLWPQHQPLLTMFDLLAIALCGGACDPALFPPGHKLEDVDARARGSPVEVAFCRLRKKFSECGYKDDHIYLQILRDEMQRDGLYAPLNRQTGRSAQAHAHEIAQPADDSEAMADSMISFPRLKTTNSETPVPHDKPDHNFIHTPTNTSVPFSEESKMSPTPSPAMVHHNQMLARYHAKSIGAMVREITPTQVTASASAAVACLLDHSSISGDGIKWTRYPKRLEIAFRAHKHTMTGYSTYRHSAAKRHSAKEQANNTLMVTANGLNLLKSLRAELRESESDDDLMSRPTSAFVLAVVLLFEEMQQLAGTDFVDGHMPNSANPNSAFSWHIDHHAELNGGEYIETSLVCQCSPGSSSIGVAGAGEVRYPGVGGMVMFPAWAMHRTLLVEPQNGGSMWKLAGFFAASKATLDMYEDVRVQNLAYPPVYASCFAALADTRASVSAPERCVKPCTDSRAPSSSGHSFPRLVAQPRAVQLSEASEAADDISKLFEVLDVPNSRRAFLRKQLKSRGYVVKVNSRITSGRKGIQRVFVDTSIMREKTITRSRKDIRSLFASWVP